MTTPRFPRAASALLRVAVPERWADSVAGDLEADWRARRARGGARLAAWAWVSTEAARIAARFALESAALGAEAFRRDVREASRALGRRPRFAAAAVVTIALGCGINVAAFTVVDRVLWQPWPYAAPERLVQLLGQETSPAPPARVVSSLDYEAWRDGLAGLADLAAYRVESVTLGLDGALPDTMPAAFVTPNLFDVLGVAPRQGRAFAPGEGRLGTPGVAVIADGLWRARFGARPDIIGLTIETGDRPYTIVGVAPPGLEFPAGVGLWLARASAGQSLRGLAIEFASLSVIGRLAGTLPPADAIAAIDARGPTVAAAAGRAASPVAVPLDEALVGGAAPALALGWAAVGFLLVLACANAASLLVTRTASRRRELTVRASLGASGVALARHVLAEGLVLAAAGGAAGLALAAAALRLFELAEPGTLPRLAGVSLTASSVAFAAGLSIAVALALSLVPALGAGRLAASDGARAAGLAARAGRGAGALVAGQLALSAVLLVAAGVTGWGLLRQVLRDPGYRADGLLVIPLRPDASLARSGATGTVYAPLVSRARSLDAVRAAAVTDHLPPSAAGLVVDAAIEGAPVGRGGGDAARAIGASAGYFEALGIPLVAGRGFTDDEVARAAAVAVIDETLAARAGGRAALGRRLVVAGELLDIVGIAGAARQGPLADAPGPVVYRPLASGAYATGGMTFLTELYLVARVEGDPGPVAAALRAAFDELPPVAQPRGVTTLSDRLRGSVAGPRFHAALFALLAALGAALAAIGVYGLVSSLVQAAAAEFGVRLALGAPARALVAQVLGRGLRVAVVGLAAGLALAPAAASLVANRLEGVAPAGPAIYAGVAALLLAVV
ncbi:MAG: ABC transporter permease, partial [Vicinamibacterales bacterium]